MIIANSALRASLAIYHLISKTRSWNNLLNISINTQVIIENRALSLARYLGLSAENHLDGQNGMAASSRFATVSEDDFALKCFFFFSFLK